MVRLFFIIVCLLISPGRVAADTYDATISPQNYNFGSINIGQSQSQTFTITNTGTGSLTFKNGFPMILSNTPNPYSITANNCGSGLSPGVSCELSVRFSPVAVGAVDGTLYYSFNEVAPNFYTVLYGTGTGTPLIPQDQLFIFANPSSIFINEISTLSVTGGSGGGEITFNLVGGPCTLSDSMLTGTGPGNCLVSATKAGDGSYASVTSSPIAITVSGPPIVLDLVATPGPGYIQLDFTTATSSIAASTSQVRTNSVVTYTGTCVSTNGGVTVSSTGTSSPLRVTGVTAGKTYSCTVTGTDGSGSSTSAPSNAVVPAPAPTPPNPIPTLSEWAQILMMLMMIGTVGWYSRKMTR